ncbi:unnamed protein product [Ambrosiozyma monospora]|uniref:Unnamed protein product n=1 Tax=Ambrosiozyma monospora TaxID=43982 RepID=A0ACB5TA10_AMBMO|nr:unnamed protein product [Ambrosiozyma monospora]
MAGIFSRYSTFLNKKPQLANALTTGFLFGAGDFIAQLGFPADQENGKDQKAKHEATLNTITNSQPIATTNINLKSILANYDYLRTLRGVLYGALIFSPIGSRLYPFLNNRIFFPSFKFKARLNQHNQKLLDTFARVCVDQLCWALVGIPLYYSCITIMEGQDWQALKLKLHENYVETLVNNWKVWPVFQMCNFFFVPVQLRLLMVNVISVLWNCYLSFENSRANQEIQHD